MIRLAATLLLLWGMAGPLCAALTFSNAYASPRNRERARRPATHYIILHTTEAEAKSSLNKLSRNGEAHYCVDRNGTVYRIVDRSRVAYHCGTSMWMGRRNLDEVSVGIEVVGYHDRALTVAQYRALKELVHTLQKTYNVKDANVMPHAQVAYGNPNRWHRRRHRGRKRCGMGYATPAVRKLLGLSERWLSDPDVKARRLVNGDAELARILYAPNGDRLLPYRLPAMTAGAAGPKPAAGSSGSASRPDPGRREAVVKKGQSAWDIARDAYNAASTLYVFPDGRQLSGDRVQDWSSILPGTRIVIGDGDAEGSPVQVLPKGMHPRALVGDAAQAADTWYFRPTGGVVQGSALSEKALSAMPPETRILVGYSRGGPVRSNRLPSQICPAQWDAGDTFYLPPGKTLTPFRSMDMRRVPPGTEIFYRN